MLSTQGALIFLNAKNLSIGEELRTHSFHPPDVGIFSWGLHHSVGPVRVSRVAYPSEVEFRQII